jgi:hypothetical protein
MKRYRLAETQHWTRQMHGWRAFQRVGEEQERARKAEMRALLQAYYAEVKRLIILSQRSQVRIASD